MSSNPARYASPSLEAFQTLLKEIDDINNQPSVVPTLDHLLRYTHILSNTLSRILTQLVKASAQGEGSAQQELAQAIEDATDSITTLKELMLAIHRLRSAQDRRFANAS